MDKPQPVGKLMRQSRQNKIADDQCGYDPVHRNCGFLLYFEIMCPAPAGGAGRGRTHYSYPVGSSTAWGTFPCATCDANNSRINCSENRCAWISGSMPF